MQQLTITKPDDWHLHLRDGDALRAVLPDTVKRFARAVVMPNLKPPVTTVALAEAYRQRIVAALPAGSKPEVVPDQQPPHPQPVHQHALDELIGRNSREVVIEAAHMHLVYSQLGELFQLFTQRAQPSRCLIRREKFTGVRLEAHHTGDQPLLPRRAIQQTEHGSMAQMHPVEVADSECDRGNRARGQVTQDTHGLAMNAMAEAVKLR